MLKEKYIAVFYDCVMNFKRCSEEYDTYEKALKCIEDEQQAFKHFGGVYHFAYAQVKKVYVME